ncbi:MULTISPECIES: heme exporter protein CcmB [unclassified Pseudomonas]|uniref:heme exporter protein CcmB n=1 Tax=unclassified Pseudomonas TaxID=196821 RepID=UPI000BCBF685|nr:MULTISPECIES: heme exporter protein CcmB [unclassified Pseudomonas]PVZ13644.1 heme exporter protein B [Pseudomonas sp. URIL14HWK12:I12]PVZ23950.1 heme exporter protein B [Pseudomonas sp. URIL14HWK12:I10]PVZ33411.1 heme exporter protein B [Pseudomonas sp. URIL14HWK12:I11]SNZ11471.1 heme exporter protein B [Pseudomonas sp. URIL14HWK12:I9]
MSALLPTLRRELRLLCRRPGDWLNPLVFFALVITLFPLGMGAEPAMLRDIAPGLIWVAALLAVMVSLDGLFRTDFDNGSLEQMVLAPQPLALLVLMRILAHWLLSGLSLVLVAPLLALMLGLPHHCLPWLMVSLLLGTPALSLIGAVGAALTVGLKRASLLLALLTLPLYIPVLILGSGTLRAALQGLPVAGYLFWLGCLAMLSITLAPLAIAAGLRISVAE